MKKLKLSTVESKFWNIESTMTDILFCYIEIDCQCDMLLLNNLTNEQENAVIGFQSLLKQWMEEFTTISTALQELKGKYTTHITPDGKQVELICNIPTLKQSEVPDREKFQLRIMELQNKCKQISNGIEMTPSIEETLQIIREMDETGSAYLGTLLNCEKEEPWKSLENMWQNLKDSFPSDAFSEIFVSFD